MSMPAHPHPAVSVCIPCYRGGDYLRAAIASVLAQRHTDFELLIVDNHSQDGTAELVRGYGDARVRFLQNGENLGAVRNWNRCLHEARGRYLKLLPQDDLIAPDCLERQVEVLERDTGQRLALVFSARTVLDGGGHPLMVRGYPARRGGPIAARALIRRCLRRGTNLIGEPGAVLFRRELAGRVGLFDASIPYVVDLDYWFRLLLHGDACYLPQPLASFRLAPGSWSATIGAGQAGEYRRFLRKIAADPRYAAGPVDVAAGSVMAQLNAGLRQLCYRWLARRLES